MDRYTRENAKIDRGSLRKMCQLAEDWQAVLLAVRCASVIVGTPDFPLEEVVKMPIVMASVVRLARRSVQVARKTKEELAKYTNV